MYFQYDTSGTPFGFIFNGTQYFYITNPMGDVIAVTEADGNIFCEYTYDEWGKLVTVNYADENDEHQISVANLNPLRYRGYYYDSETEYYYLQSRYYDPSICRFINADVPEIAKVSKDTSVGTNLFAYCNNDPINNADYNGFVVTPANIIGAIIGIVIGVVGGYFLSKWLANKLNLSGWKRNVFIVGLTSIITASATIIGYFIGGYIGKLANYIIDSIRRIYAPRFGSQVGRLGKLVKNTRPAIKGLTTHGSNRMIERGVTKAMAQKIVNTGYAVAQANGKILYFSKIGVVVLTSSGNIVTTYSAKYFDVVMQAIIKVFFG